MSHCVNIVPISFISTYCMGDAGTTPRSFVSFVVLYR